MNAQEIIDLIRNGESSTTQFKPDVSNSESIAQEIVAFANSKGGKILVGVDDKTGNIAGVEFRDIQRINNLVATAANDHVKSPVYVQSETIQIENKRIILITVPEGTDKPHTDKDGLIFIKNGSDKRKVVSREELARLLQASGNLYAEERIIRNSSVEDVDWEKFREFYEKKYKESFEKESLERYLQNLRLMEDGKLNIAGALLFGRNPSKLIPSFYISAVWFRGTEITNQEYKSSENITGTADILYRKAFDFIFSKLNKIQADQPFNSLGIPEIPEIVLKELLVNAVIHRDYFISDSIKIFMFDDRIEIRNPGKLPNNLTIEQIRKGLRRSRNSTGFSVFVVFMLAEV
ncbi:MAG: putative DNA binding domain-containing protein [Ignavibacteriaceae bacterium]|nr:putative DNA binding domain-containing protein [Ignavibacteriaceae bacterium]